MNQDNGHGNESFKSPLDRWPVVPATQYQGWGEMEDDDSDSAAQKREPDPARRKGGSSPSKEPQAATPPGSAPESAFAKDAAEAQPPDPGPVHKLENEREYRYCKAVVDQPFQASSVYAKLSRMSSKTIKPIRDRLVSIGLLRIHILDKPGPGARAMLIEPLPAGIHAVQIWEADHAR